MTPELYTKIPVAQMPFRLDFASGIVSLGSCFADEIGSRLHNGGFCIEQNPFGTLYNPASIAAALHRIVDDSEITEADLVQHEGLWHSWHHHGSFSRATKEECLQACNSHIHQAHTALKEASLLMVTFGTAWVFEHDGAVVANCHKLPPQQFVRRRMDINEIESLWQPLLKELHAYYPTLNILFTVSPIRHMADGAHGNQLSKSTLLLAIDQLTTQAITQSSNQAIAYFPSYEIVLDELRDYRFFAADMAHPTPLAVDIVWDRFQQACMTPAVIQQAHLNAKRHKREKHIPLH
ncbi:MAG: GSCFA domain-containing protein [Bacteroidales bacterium]|nr:GSCFA domain-containing protein [Bacteroidales bacterium]